MPLSCSFSRVDLVPQPRRIHISDFEMATLFPGNQALLPPFSSLLIQGPYRPSAPVHLALSHTSRSGSDALFVSPSRQRIIDALVASNDTSLDSTGKTSSVSSRVKMLWVLFSLAESISNACLLGIHRHLLIFCFSSLLWRLQVIRRRIDYLTKRRHWMHLQV